MCKRKKKKIGFLCEVEIIEKERKSLLKEKKRNVQYMIRNKLKRDFTKFRENFLFLAKTVNCLL